MPVIWFLLLDRVLEMADIVRVCNLDRKDAIHFIAKDPTVEAVEAELAMVRHDARWMFDRDPTRIRLFDPMSHNYEQV